MQPISTALLSFGMSGRLFHAPFVHTHPGFALDAVWERSRNEAESVYPGIRVYRTLEALLADDTIELVVVNTPNYTHYDYARAALEAGKHVVVEKPFTVRSEEADELMALAEEQGLLISVYQNRRYDSDYRSVRQVLEEGALGGLVEAEFRFDRYRTGLSPKVHKEVPGPGTGALYDLGSHLIDQALQLFGPPQFIFADIRTVRPLSQIDDYFDLLLFYPSFRLRLHSSILVREPGPGYQLHGTHGSFIRQRTDEQEKRLQAGEAPDLPDWGVEPEEAGGLLHTDRNGETIRRKLPPLRGNYMDYYEALYRAIREGAPVPVTARQGRDVIRLIELAFQSAEEGRKVEVK